MLQLPVEWRGGAACHSSSSSPRCGSSRCESARLQIECRLATVRLLLRRLQLEPRRHLVLPIRGQGTLSSRILLGCFWATNYFFWAYLECILSSCTPLLISFACACYLFVAAAVYNIKSFSFVSCSISINPSPHIFLQFIEAVRVDNSVSQPISSLFYD